MKYYVLVILFMALGIVGCDGQVEKNIGRLEAARDRLEADPKDDEALSSVLQLLSDRNAINRSNAAVILGQAAERVGPSIKDRALPALIKLLDEGNSTDKRAAAEGFEDSARMRRKQFQSCEKTCSRVVPITPKFQPMHWERLGSQPQSPSQTL